ncbi:MAG: ATP-dependent DNA helicase PcrA [Burkholderiales bacterium RIFCSPLOWO2_12_FULL_61_40]|nr:MAG: ATP-dependent DNA helicase PcrA [Burkholderiales bacterium RIFCSPLOWO2_12_FULL_61_40]
MTSRAHQPDTAADLALYECLNGSPPRSFLMIAGAGSGKTTSLIKGLTQILDKHGDRLRLRRQKVACITYTVVAAEEIWKDVGENPLVHVSTIHSFLWSLIRTFQADIKVWVANRVDEKIAELHATVAGFGPRVQQRTRDKAQGDIVRYEQQRSKLNQVGGFTYGLGSDYTKGILGHDDIIKMVPHFIENRPLMRTLVANQYPFLFVDESQDTTANVVAALKAVDAQMSNHFCLGFFGDPMQKIYPTGIGKILLEPNWENITKPENFRCPATVLSVANAIRGEDDGLLQSGGRMEGTTDALISVEGRAHVFILPISDQRDQKFAQVRAWISEKYDDPLWMPGLEVDNVKLLVIVHRMAAKRLGFGDLYAALNDKAPESFKNGFLDGTAWPVRHFKNFVLPLVSASRSGNDFEVMQIFRSQSPLLERARLKGVNVAEQLSKLRQLLDTLQQMMEPQSEATNADVLLCIHASGAITLDSRLLSYLNLPVLTREENADMQQPEEENDEEELTKEIAAMDAFLACRASQFWGYDSYVNDASPFSTQQGVKGAEFDRVLVVLDDDEGTHVQFSYDKYLGVKPLSPADLKKIAEGGETSIERTRRLFYVCCTRARQDLAVVLFTSDVLTAQVQIKQRGLFPSNAIHLEDVLAEN